MANSKKICSSFYYKTIQTIPNMVKSIRCGFYSTLWLNWMKMHHIIPYNFDSTYWNVIQLNCPSVSITTEQNP
jgi:hypothetical protein